MTKLIAWLVLLVSLSVASFAGTVPVTGTVRDSGGARANGSIRFHLNQSGATDTSCTPNPCLISPIAKVYPLSAGNLPSYAALTPNDVILPHGTAYSVDQYDSFGSLVQSYYVVIPSGGTFDLGNAQQSAITTNNVSLVNPVSLSANNTFSGNNTFTGTTTFAGNSVFNGTATFNATIAGNATFTGSITTNGNWVAVGVFTAHNNVVMDGTTVTVNNMVFGGSVARDGGGVKHIRGAVGCTTAASVGAVCTSGAQTWPGSAFSSTSYTLTCTLDTPTGIPTVSTVTKSTASFTITIAALTAAGATANYNCTAVHD